MWKRNVPRLAAARSRHHSELGCPGCRGNPSAGRRAAVWLAHRAEKWRRSIDIRRDSLKYASQLAFWDQYWVECGGRFPNAHYRRVMLAMAGRENEDFLRDKIVADFGCGPAGSLCWATPARQRVGIDVLADAYSRFGTTAHDMSYIQSSEHAIPLPSGCVDVLFTLNALDHVSRLRSMCRELVRILTPRGEFFGSFNLHEPRAACEPQKLTEALLRRRLLGRLEVGWRAFVPKVPENPYGRFLRGDMSPTAPAGPAILWVRARKPAI